jgi:hypothetical protein
MYRIIEGRSCGKTSRLMLLAKETGAAIACSNPSAMRAKAYAYGITGIDFISYSDLFTGGWNDKVLIDEMEDFVKQYTDADLIGYSLTNED